MLCGRLAWLKGDRRAAAAWWADSRQLAGQMNVRFDLGRTLLDSGRYLQDSTALSQAIAIFEATDSAWELGQARALAAAGR